MSDSLMIRARLIYLLSKWQRRELSTEKVHAEAESLFRDFVCDEVPRSEPKSILNEVLIQLDILNHQLIIEEDIPAILKFLQTPPTALESGWQIWEAYWNSIDFQDRRQRLANNPYYAV